MYEDNDYTRSNSQARAHRVTLTKTNDDGEQQTLDYDGLAGEKHTGVVRVQYFGLSSHAPAGSEGMVLTMSDRDTAMILGIESPSHRPTGMPEGGTRIYDTNGSYVDLDAAGTIKAVSATAITIETETINLKASTMNVEVGTTNWTGDINQTGSHTDTDAAPD